MDIVVLVIVYPVGKAQVSQNALMIKVNTSVYFHQSFLSFCYGKISDIYKGDRMFWGPVPMSQPQLSTPSQSYFKLYPTLSQRLIILKQILNIMSFHP